MSERAKRIWVVLIVVGLATSAVAAQDPTAATVTLGFLLQVLGYSVGFAILVGAVIGVVSGK